MKKCLLLLFLLTACSYRYAPMTTPAYQEISVGIPITQVEKKFGAPNAIHRRNNEYIYEYIMRNYLGDQLVSADRYLFVVNDKGIITNKYTTTRDAPPFELLVDPSPP